MALIFKSGSSPNYSGEIFETAESLLENIRDWLQSAGWSIRDDFISGSELLVMEGFSDNSDSCFIRFTISDRTGILNGKQLNIQGDLDGSNSTLSESLIFEFIEDASNIIYLTADIGSFCILVESYELILNSGHCGFLDQPDASLDTFGWMVGRIDWRVNNAYWAKSFRNGTNWRRVGDDYWYADNMSDQRNQVSYGGLWDRYCVSLTETTNEYSANNGGYHKDYSRNTGYYGNKGAISPITNLPLLGEYYYLEGRGYNKYGDDFAENEPPPLAFRGIVRHATIGIASLPAKMQVTDKSGNRYISTGGFGNQGFRIA